MTEDSSPARYAALLTEVALLRRERDQLRAELRAARAERDRLRLRVLDLEIMLSVEPSCPVERVVPVLDTVDTERADAAERRAAGLARELAATQETVSWRVTAPLRAVRRRIGKP
jgi:hypothetical protein